MSDIRCPMCAKPNPEGAEICQYCKARLKPLISPSPGDSPAIRAGQEPINKDNTELGYVRPAGGQDSIHPGQLPTKKNTEELEPALPAWLRALRQPNAETPSGQGAEKPADKTIPLSPAPELKPEELPDWLADLDSESQKAEEIPGWLSSIHSKVQEEGSSPVAEKAAPAGGEAREQATPPPGPPHKKRPAGTEPLEELPSWLARLKASVAALEEKPVETPAAAEPLPSAETPDWLSRLRTEPARIEAAAIPSGQEPEPLTAPADEVPDWLSKLQAETVAPVAAGEPEAAPAGEQPDWLTNFQMESFASQDANAAPAPAAPASEIPDWLSKFQPAVPEETPAEHTPPPPVEIPAAGGQADWLDRIQSLPVASAESAFTVESEDSRSGEMPEWLAQARKDIEQSEEARSVIPQAAPPPPQREPVPDWLADVRKTPSGASAMPAFVLGEEDVTGHEVEAIFSMDMPEWLSTIKPEDAKKESSAGEVEEAGAELQRGELPSWVEAMRPVESVVSETAPAEQDLMETSAEERGPLAGLRGVLPGGAVMLPSRKTPVHSSRLQLSDTQGHHAALLESIVSAETKGKEPGGLPKILSMRVLRWAISAFLILAVSIPLVTGLRIVPATLLYPSELTPTLNLVSAISGNAPVLLVFDYEPALAAELEAAAAPVIDRLLFTGARLTLVSSSPTGPILAESFLETTQAEHNYQSGQQYVNLGYLAGGPAGVLNFAADPPGAAPLTVSGLPAWELPPLLGVQKLSDFALMIILTDNADTGRTWIEQAGAYLGGRPVLMIISAQTEPMIRPYYDSKQVAGLVTGLAGGKYYAQAIERPNLADKYWDAFSLGMLVAVVTIFAGSLWSVISGWRARRSEKEEKTQRCPTGSTSK